MAQRDDGLRNGDHRHPDRSSPCPHDGEKCGQHDDGVVNRQAAHQQKCARGGGDGTEDEAHRADARCEHAAQQRGGEETALGDAGRKADGTVIEAKVGAHFRGEGRKEVDAEAIGSGDEGGEE